MSLKNAAVLYFGATIILCVCWRVSSAVQTAIVIGEVELRDSSRPSYSVNLPEVGSRAPRRVTFSSRKRSPLRMATANGQVMQCKVPAPPPRKKNAKLVDSVVEQDGIKLFSDVDELLKEYEEKCFLRRDGWWTFEFCYGSRVIQKHVAQSPGEAEDEFVLGEFNPDEDVKRRANVSEVLRPNAAFTQLYTNGTECDLTGIPRQILIKYMCLEEAVQVSDIAKAAGIVNFIRSVREVESCVYELEFINGRICEQRLYKEKLKASVLDIDCEMADGQGPFQGFRSTDYKRSSLNL